MNIVNDIWSYIAVFVVTTNTVRRIFSVGGRVGRKGGVSHTVVSVQAASRRRCASGVRALLEPPGDRGRRLRGRDARGWCRMFIVDMTMVVSIAHG